MSKRGAFRAGFIIMLVWLTAVWVFLWGSVTVANVLGGIVVALAVMAFFPLPGLPMTGRLRPIRLLILIAVFNYQLFVASFQVAWTAIVRGPRTKSAIIRVRLYSRSDLYLTWTSMLVSLVPGTLVIEVRRTSSEIFVHCLDVDTPEQAKERDRDVHDIEELIVRTFGSAEEIAQFNDHKRMGLAAADERPGDIAYRTPSDPAASESPYERGSS